MTRPAQPNRSVRLSTIKSSVARNFRLDRNRGVRLRHVTLGIGTVNWAAGGGIHLSLRNRTAQINERTAMRRRPDGRTDECRTVPQA